MGRLFGTDGIRGVANEDLGPLVAYALGRAVAYRMAPGGGSIALGQDTRRSSDMLAAAIIAGATSLGADVHRLGVLPTPALAHLTAEGDFSAGVMVSASHNPADDNGLKVLGPDGLKLPDPVEDELERLMAEESELAGPRNAGLGREIPRPELVADYVAHRSDLASRFESRLHVVLDCANGSAGAVAPGILRASGARVDAIFDAPDGVNINLGCGATAPGALAREVVVRGADVGFALDGDGDRCIAVDAQGEIVDGDRIMGILALDRLERGTLPGGTVIVTVLSNGGLVAVIERAGGRVVRTPVGDRYIVEGLLAHDAGLGGEKSGHVVVREHAMSGDGTLTAVAVLEALARSGRTLADLAAAIPLYPQEQRNVVVRHKDRWESDPLLRDAIIEADRRLAGQGRVLVRPSGTEATLRVMVEGADGALVASLADLLAHMAEERLN